jgi:PAS domain S-box-containing protein
MVAVEDHTSEPKALLGRILANRFVSDLPVTINAPLHVGTTIVDSQQNVVFQTNKLDLRLDFDAESTIEAFSKLDEVQPQGGISTLINSISGKPLVMRIFSPSDHPWKIGLSIPMSMVTISALETTGSYSMIWLFLTLLAVFILLTVGRAFSQPLTELETATQHLAIGKLDYPITTSRGGGFDGLGNAIRDIRSKLRKQQLRQLLLLNTSSTMAGTINIEQAIPRILLAVLRGTDATSARCIVSRKDGRIPLLFGEGPSTVAASKLDNQILELLKDQNQIILKSSVQVRDALDLTAFTHVPAAIFGIRLKLKAAYYGALWVEFDSDRQLDPDELIFIHSLSDQVLLLLENARLFSATESNRRQLAAVLANASDAVLVVDTKGRIRLINRAAEEYLAMPSADAIGQQSREVIRYQTLIDALGEPGGEPRYIEFSVENRDLAGMISILTNKRKQPIGKVVVLHDVSKLKAADKTKGDLLKIMSHDLRNPLASVRNYTELLRMTSDLPANQERWINGIDSGVHQIGRLLDDLSSAQRFDNDSEMGTGEIDISQLLHQIAVEALPQAESENTILTVSLSDDVPVVKGQSIFIRQAVLNLVDNAIKYAPGSETIDLSAVVQDDKVIISVSDQGPGIPKSELERIFEMFYQYSGYDNPPKLGTGLGLALVRSIVERHKGTVWCESTVGQGSTFKISLPIMS